MRIALFVIISVHATIHGLGVAKGFGLPAPNALQTPISRPMGVLWLAAGVLLWAAAASLLIAPRWFWLVGGLGVLASQSVIITCWHDARFGTLANVVVAAAAVYFAFARGPFGLRAEYERLVHDGVAELTRCEPPPVVTEADLDRLPHMVQRYLRFVGVVGAPRPMGFRVTMHGRIRGAAHDAWMPFVAEQHTFFNPPRRYFWMRATRGGVPLDGLHIYGASDASMRIRLLSLFSVIDVRGPALMKTETVTMLNDISIFTPAMLLESAIEWHELDARHVQATYRNGPHTIRAVLVFAESGELENFWSDDRPALAQDGSTMTPMRWSTPIREYRAMDGYQLASRGQGRYAPPSGEYAYLELDNIAVTQLTRAPGASQR
jgi:hypothetical protein